MIRPFVLLYSSLKLGVIIGSTADIDDEKIIVMILVEVIGDISDRISIYFLKEIRCRIGHSNNTISNIS